MPATMATLQTILKNFYIGPIRENLNMSTVLSAQLKKSSKEVVGEQVILPLHVGRNWGIGARGTTGNGALPAARNQQYNRAIFSTKDVYGRVEVRGKTIRATKTDKGAFLRAVQSEIQGMTKDLASDNNRQFHGDATGVLTQVNGAQIGVTQITVDSTQYLEEGQVLDIGGDVDQVVSTVDSPTQFTIVAPAITVADDDNIRLADVGATDELNGLALIVNNAGALHGIAAAGVWRGNVFGADATPIALDEADMQEAQDEAERLGGKVDYIETSYAGRRAYINLLADQKRFTSPQTGKLKGGFEYIDFNNIPLVVDRHCQATAATTRFYFLTLDSLGIYRMADYDWMQEDGNILARQVGAGALESYEATLVCDMELGCNARRHNSVLVGVLPA